MTTEQKTKRRVRRNFKATIDRLRMKCELSIEILSASIDESGDAQLHTNGQIAAYKSVLEELSK